MISAASGSEQGISRRSTCTLVNASGGKVTDSCILIRVDKRVTVVKTNATFDQVIAGLRVKFIPGDPEE